MSAAASALERELAAQVNAHRRTKGLSGLRYDDRIAGLAREHSRRMARGEVRFGHEGMRTRAERLVDSHALSGLAENVARRHRAVDVPGAVLRGWLRSGAHRVNLEGDYHLTGVGAARGEAGDLYLTQLYVRVRR